MKVRRKEGGREGSNERTKERRKEGRRSMYNICETGPTYAMDASINARRIDPKWRERENEQDRKKSRT